jgi:hypothetical protein
MIVGGFSSFCFSDKISTRDRKDDRGQDGGQKKLGATSQHGWHGEMNEKCEA